MHHKTEKRKKATDKRLAEDDMKAAYWLQYYGINKDNEQNFIQKLCDDVNSQLETNKSPK